MLFDRYEIHIQGSVHFTNGKLIIFQSATPQHILRICTQKKNTNKWYQGHTCFEKIVFLNLKLTQITFSHDDSMIFLVFFEAFW